MTSRDAHHFEQIDAVFAGDVLAAAGEFFGENGAAQEQDGHAERGDGSAEEAREAR